MLIWDYGPILDVLKGNVIDSDGTLGDLRGYDLSFDP